MAKEYIYQGDSYTEEEVSQASADKNLSVDDYVQEFGLEVIDTDPPNKKENGKKKKDTQNKEDATAVSTDGASSSEDTSSDSTGVKAPAPTGSYYDPELGRQVPIYPDVEKPKESPIPELEGEISITQPPDSDQVNISTNIPSEDAKTNIDIDEKDQEIIVALRTGGNLKKTKLVEADAEAGDFSISVEEEIAPGLIGTRENEQEIIEEFQKPEGQAILNVELETGVEAVKSRRKQLYGVTGEETIKTFPTDEGSQTTFTTPGGEGITITTAGPILQKMGVPDNVNVITTPSTTGDDFEKQDKQRIADESLAYIPLDERDDAVRLRQIKEDIKELKDPGSEKFQNIISKSKPLEIGENLNSEMKKLLKEADKIVENLQKDQDYAGGKLYDWNTGKFVTEDEANEELIGDVNAGVNKYEGTSLDKLEDLRYKTGLELIHLGTNAHYDKANIINNSAETIVGELLTKGPEGLGAEISDATQQRKTRSGEYEQEAQEISDIGLDKQIITEYKGDLQYDFNRLEELTRTRSIPKGLTLLPPSTLSAMRYNEKLKEFYYINRALELNEQRDFSVREPLLDIAEKSIVGVVTDDSYYNRREINDKLIDMQQEIVGGDPAFWNTLRALNGGGYYDPESGEIVTDTWWRDQFEDLAGGLGPLLQMSMEFFTGAGMVKLLKTGKYVQWLSKYGAKYWDDLLYGSKTYQNTNIVRTTAINFKNSRAGEFFTNYFGNAFNEYMVIEGYNLIKWTQNGFEGSAGDFLTGSGDDMISGNFVWGAAAMKTIWPSFSKYLRNKGSDKVNYLINLYNDNKIIGGLVNKSLQPAFAASTIMAGEAGQALLEGDLKKFEEIFNLENAFQLYGTMAIVRYATPESFDTFTKTMRELNSKFTTWRKNNNAAINRAAKDFGLPSDRWQWTSKEIDDIANERLKKEGITEKEVLDIEYKRRLLQATNDIQYYEVIDGVNQEKYQKEQGQINKLLDNLLENNLGQDYRDVESILTYGDIANQARLFDNLKTKAADKSPQEVDNLITKLKNFYAEADAFNKITLESGMNEGEKAALWNLTNENAILLAKKQQLEEEAKKLGIDKTEYQTNRIAEIDQKMARVNNKMNDLVNKKNERIKNQNIQSEQFAKDLNTIAKAEDFNFVSNDKFLEITGNEYANGVKLGKDGKIYVNRDRINKTEWIVRDGNVLKVTPKGGVLGHEIFHRIEQLPEFENLTETQKRDLVERFKQELTLDELRKVKQLSPGKLSDATNTEWINYYVQAVIAGDIKPTSPKSELNFSDVNLDNAKQFKTWVDNFARDIQKGAIKDYLKDAIVRSQKNFDNGKLDFTPDQYSELTIPETPTKYDAESVSEVERLIAERNKLRDLNVSESKSGTADKATLINRSNRIKEINRKLDDPKYAINAVFAENKANWDQVKNTKQVQDRIIDLYDDLLNTWADKAERIISDKYPGARFNRGDFIAEMKGARGILDALDKFDISKQQEEGWSLNGWINYIVKTRQPEFLENSVDGYKVDVDKTTGPSYTMDEDALMNEVESETQSTREQLQDKIPTFSKGDNYFEVSGTDMFTSKSIPDETIEDIRRFVTKDNNPKIIFTGGLPGSGKSTGIDILTKKIPELENYEVFNVDYYIEKAKKKKGLPTSPPPKGTVEYQKYSQELGRIMAEARKETKAKRDAAIAKGKNIIVDGTAASMGDKGDVVKTFDQAMETNKYRPVNVAIIDFKITKEESLDAQQRRAEGGGRGLDTRVIENTYETYTKSDKDRRNFFNIDQSKRVITNGAKWLKVNQDVELNVSDKVTDPIYDKLLEEGGGSYYNELLKDLGSRTEYDETLKKLKPFVDRLDPRIYKKYGIDIYYEPIMTEGGGSQKKIDGVLQFRELEPTDKQYMDYWMGVGKTANTKGNRKQMLAKIIGAQMEIDGVMEAARVAAENNGIVPVYDNKGRQTGTIDVYEGLTPEQRIERKKDYYIAELGNKLRRDPNQQFSEDSFAEGKDLLMELPADKRDLTVWMLQNANRIVRLKDNTGLTDQDLRDLIDKISKTTAVKDIKESIDEEFTVEYTVKTDAGIKEIKETVTDDATVEKIGDNEYVVRTQGQNLEVEKGVKKLNKDFDKTVFRDAEGFKNIVDAFNEGLPEDQQIQAVPLPGSKGSPYTDVLGINGEQARQDAYNRLKRYNKNIAAILNRLPKEVLDKHGTDILKSLGWSKYKTTLNNKGELVRVKIGELGDKPMESWLGGEKITGTDVEFDYPSNIMSNSQTSGNIKKYHLGKVFGEYRVPNPKGKKNKKGEIITERKQATSYEQAQEWKKKGYKQVTEGYVDTYDLKPGDTLPKEAQIDFKKGFQEKFTDGEVTFDEVVAANKKLLNELMQAYADEVISRANDPGSLRDLTEDAAYFFRLQTNVGDGIVKGAFTVTNITNKVPFETTKDSPTHAEHNLALSAFTNNVLRDTKQYLQGEITAEEFKSKLEALAKLGTQSIILRSQQRFQDVDPTTGKSRKGTGTDLQRDTPGDVAVQAIEDFKYMYDSIDLTGDPNKAYNVLDGSIKKALSNNVDNLPVIEKINELEKDLNTRDLSEADIERLEIINEKLFKDALDDLELNDKDLAKTLRELESMSDRYSEDTFEKDNAKFNAGMRQSLGDKWNKLPTSKDQAIKEGIENQSKRAYPYSAMDYETLLYQLLPSKGGQQFKDFLKEKLIDTYWKGVNEMESDRVAASQDITTLNKFAKDKGISPNDGAISTESGFTYTNDDVARIYLWNKNEVDIPGLSKDIKDKALDYINSKPELLEYANEIDRVAKGDYPDPNEAWIMNNVAGDIQNKTSRSRSKYLKEWNENFDNIFNEDNLNKLQAEYGPKYVQNLKDIKERMLQGSNRVNADYISRRIMNVFNQGVGATMNFNTRSAFMQGLSALNYINTSFNNVFRISQALLRPDLVTKDFIRAWTSDYLRDRRGTGSIDIAQGDIEDAANSKNPLQSLLNLYLKAGYIPSKIMDSWAQACGASTWIRNKAKYDILKRPGNEDMSLDEAMDIAEKDWVEYSRKTQQSNDPALLSGQQVSLLGRSLLQYGNTQQQYFRKTYQDVLDILAGRKGDGTYADLLYSIANYGFMQHIAYGFFFNALFTILADEDTPDEEKAKYMKTLSGILDANLKGMGIVGALVGSGKNVALELAKNVNILLDRQEALEAGKPTTGLEQPNFEKVLDEIIRLVPALSGRIQMIEKGVYHAEQAGTKRYNEEKDELPFYKNAELNAIASGVEGILAAPLEELLRKFEAWDYMLNSDAETWKKIAVFAGYEPWQLESKEKEEQMEAMNKEKEAVEKQMKKNQVGTKIRNTKIRTTRTR